MSETRSGFVALIGRPNAGKSTLLNWLLGEKIAMVSHKAQATRKRLYAIVMHGDDQIIFIDTPGLHEKERLLNKFMLEEAIKAIGDCDLILFLAPVTDPITYYEKFLELAKKRPHIVVLTKIDMVSNEKLLQKIAEYQKFQNQFLELVPVSVKKDIGKKDLLDTIVRYLPKHPYYYDPELLTTENIKDIYKELIREAIFENVSDEIPYESDVIIEKIEESPTLDKVYAMIIVEKPSQKGILIGKQGTTLKRIGKDARKLMEEFSQKKIFLNLFVVVKKGWTKNKKDLETIGYKL
ncbi:MULTISPECIES: GTPase Era [unclassified Nitratiruptor]|uniref:GTPase Era n=1 Tax=unclassified Nitratiruptor TaxID=2624044 RepID=UPI0019152464|nr:MULTISPECIES: GTPase Era [unclassified Nitratiruptor]BCD60283.1 GTP-binding protein Era [Nitratiruptor sp. YY08-10]BCD64228.1 GTP-binding protein Era [Nitratiruptor sp. YY08-14]